MKPGAAGLTPQLLVFPELGLLPRTDDPHSAFVSSVIRQDEDGHGQAADEEDGVHGALSVEVGFLGKLLGTVSLLSPGSWEGCDEGCLPSLTSMRRLLWRVLYVK